MPIVRRCMEYQRFGNALNDMTEIDAQAYMLMQDIIDTKREFEEMKK